MLKLWSFFIEKLNMFNALGKCVYLCIIMQNKN